MKPKTGLEIFYAKPPAKAHWAKVVAQLNREFLLNHMADLKALRRVAVRKRKRKKPMKSKLKSILLAVPLALMALAVIPVQTGCTTTGGGTNTFNVTAAATAIKAVLGPLVVYEENADPSTVVDFQTTSAALGVLISNSSTDTAALSAALQNLGKTDLVKLAISEAVGLYAIYLGQSVANGVSQNDTAKVLLQAFKDALDSGVKAQSTRVKAARAPAKTSK